MDRRAFVTGLGAVLAAPNAVAAQQQKKIPRIGVLVPVELESRNEPNAAAFRRAFDALGYTEGQNVVVEYRYAHGNEELYAKLTSEFAGAKVDVMVVGSTVPTLAAMKATQTIPIVGVGMGTDPVRLGDCSELQPTRGATSQDWLGSPDGNSRASGSSC